MHDFYQRNGAKGGVNPEDQRVRQLASGAKRSTAAFSPATKAWSLVEHWVASNVEPSQSHNEQIDWLLKGKMWRSGLGIEQRVDFFAPHLLAATNMSKGWTACLTNCTGADRVLARTEHRTCPERC